MLVFEDLDVRRYNPSKGFVQTWRSDEEATAELTAMGPGVLAMVFDNYDNLWHEDQNIFVENNCECVPANKTHQF